MTQIFANFKTHSTCYKNTLSYFKAKKFKKIGCTQDVIIERNKFDGGVAQLHEITLSLSLLQGKVKLNVTAMEVGTDTTMSCLRPHNAFCVTRVMGRNRHLFIKAGNVSCSVSRPITVAHSLMWAFCLSITVAWPCFVFTPSRDFLI